MPPREAAVGAATNAVTVSAAITPAATAAVSASTPVSVSTTAALSRATSSIFPNESRRFFDESTLAA